MFAPSVVFACPAPFLSACTRPCLLMRPRKQRLEGQAANLLRQTPAPRRSAATSSLAQALTPWRRLICPVRPSRPPAARSPGSAQVAFPSCDPLRKARGRGEPGVGGGEWQRCMAEGERGGGDLGLFLAAPMHLPSLRSVVTALSPYLRSDTLLSLSSSSCFCPNQFTYPYTSRSALLRIDLTPVYMSVCSSVSIFFLSFITVRSTHHSACLLRFLVCLSFPFFLGGRAVDFILSCFPTTVCLNPPPIPSLPASLAP